MKCSVDSTCHEYWDWVTTPPSGALSGVAPRLLAPKIDASQAARACAVNSGSQDSSIWCRM